MAEPLRHVEHVMGTVFSFDVRTPPTSAVREALAAGLAWLHRMDAVMSPYRPESQISRLDRGDLPLRACDPEVREVLALCAEVGAQTGGRFSATAAGRLDPSAVVKGWAVEHVSTLLHEAGAGDHAVNGGGDVQTRGEAAPGRPWRIGVADPSDRTRVLTVVEGRDLAVATSGTAERGRHIVDPATGRPAEGLLSLTLTGRHLTWLDPLSTAVFTMGEAARDWLAGRTDVAALAVTADGLLWSTPAGGDPPGSGHGAPEGVRSPGRSSGANGRRPTKDTDP